MQTARWELLNELRISSQDQNPVLFEKKTVPIHELTIREIIQYSGETEIYEIALKDNVLTILAHLPNFGEQDSRFDDDVDEITVRLKITANIFQVNIPKEMPLSVWFRLHCLENCIEKNKWGHYVPSTDKSEFFQHQKLGYSLAYGYHHKKFPWLFSVISSSHLVDVLLPNLECIEFQLEPEHNCRRN